MDVKVYKAPKYFCSFADIPVSIFLGGTIDNGSSYNWQEEFITKLRNTEHHIYDEFLVFNPRRDNWNKSAAYQDQVDQIEWEYEYLDFADIIIMNILPDSKSPISLMEIGLYARSGKLLVFCQPEFYRYANVETVCRKYKIPLYHTNNVDAIIRIMLDR